MKLAKTRRIGLVLGAVALLIPVLLATPGDAVRSSDAKALEKLWNSSDPFDRIVRDATRIGYSRAGDEIRCIEVGDIAFCLHPDTDRSMGEEILRRLPTYSASIASGKIGFNKAGRWSTTATNPTTGTEGDPITITWSFVPDGTMADGAPSTMFADFTAEWGGGTGWMEKIRNAFQRWDDVLGVVYIEVSDDGATLPNSPGLLGARGDVRLSGRSIDGSGNVLAYNWYPNGGDMVIDTDDCYYYHIPTNNFATLKATVAHEHGHGLGLGHVIPSNCTKLMEPYSCGSQFPGPLDDDIRGGMRLYGDKRENNDTPATATVLGVLTDTLFLDTLSVDRPTDLDWYRFTADGDLSVWVDPTGSRYEVGNDGGSTSWVATDSILDLDFCIKNSTGTVLLDSVYSAGLGATEVRTGFHLPSSGDYQIKVFRKTGASVQRYTLKLVRSVSTGVTLADGSVPPASSLALSVAPNPFNPTTTAKFFASAAGPYSVEVYDVTGRLSRTLQGRASGAGWIEVPWDGRDEAGAETGSGVYLMRVRSGGLVETERAVLVR
jgi:hypothetical protein